MIGKSNTALRVKRKLDARVLDKKGQFFGATRLQELEKQNKANVDETKRRIEILQNQAKNVQQSFKQRLKRLKKRLEPMTTELMAKWEQYEEEERKKEKRKSRR